MKKLVNDSISSYCDALARAVPTPGGGSSAALVGALGVGLLEMGMGYSSFSNAHLKQIRKIRMHFMKLVDEDAQAYRGVVRTWKKGASQKKKALVRATEVPLEICQLCQEGLRLAERWQSQVRPTLKNDWITGEVFLRTAFKASSLNVRENLKQLKRTTIAVSLQREWQRVKNAC